MGSDWGSVQLKRRDRLAIVGGGPTRRKAPYEDRSWDIWAFSSQRYAYPRVDVWFEIHHMTDLKQQLSRYKPHRRSYRNYMQFIRSLACPVVMHTVQPAIPHSVELPKDQLIEHFGPCFTSTASYMLALAILEGYQEIGLWGINPRGSTYAIQRPALAYLLGVARQRGIRLSFPRSFSIRIPSKPKRTVTKVLYAYDWRSPRAWWRARLRRRRKRVRTRRRR